MRQISSSRSALGAIGALALGPARRRRKAMMGGYWPGLWPRLRHDGTRLLRTTRATSICRSSDVKTYLQRRIDKLQSQGVGDLSSAPRTADTITADVVRPRITRWCGACELQSPQRLLSLRSDDHVGLRTSQWGMDERLTWSYGGYGGYGFGLIHMVVWAVILIAIVAGVVWLVRSMAPANAPAGGRAPAPPASDLLEERSPAARSIRRRHSSPARSGIPRAAMKQAEWESRIPLTRDPCSGNLPKPRPIMRRGEVELRADRHDAGRVHLALAAVIVPLDLRQGSPSRPRPAADRDRAHSSTGWDIR